MTTGFKCTRCSEFEPVEKSLRKSFEERVDDRSIWVLSASGGFIGGKLCETCRKEFDTWMDEYEEEH